MVNLNITIGKYQTPALQLRLVWKQAGYLSPLPGHRHALFNSEHRGLDEDRNRDEPDAGRLDSHTTIRFFGAVSGLFLLSGFILA
jgi:hypothetical protein